MSQSKIMAGFSKILTLVLLSSLISLANVNPVSADPGKMTWTTVDTPSLLSNVVVSPSEINVLAIGSDGRTFYAVDIPAPHTPPDVSIGKVYKSTDGGVTWMTELSGYLTAAGAKLPVWNLAVAPDDVNFVVAVTDNISGPLPGGPKQVYISTNGGATWQNTNFPPLGTNEFISCVDVSVTYGGTDRDIAIGTRDGLGNGRVWVLKAGIMSPSWSNQNLPMSDVVALKFSPTYTSDISLAVISSSAVDTRLHLGIRDTAANTTAWNTVGGYPVLIFDAGFAGTSPTASQIITADLELPSDFSGQGASNLRRFYVSTDAIAPAQSGVYRVDDTMVYGIRPPVTAPTTGRISSIAYWGTWDSGVLLAGEVKAGVLISSPDSSGVYVWRTSNPNQTVGVPTWTHSDARKSPTGGDTSNFANAQVAWSSDGTKAYCGTSSADLSAGGTSMLIPGSWPLALTTSAPLDESAFSVSPYSPDYEGLLDFYGKPKDGNIGNVWNQLSLIDTQISQLSDVAALEVPEAAEAPTDYNILYLVSMDTGGFANIWRSTSDPPGRTWERILRTLAAATTDDLILRVKQPAYDETVRSQCIVYADLHTRTVGYSSDEGQFWYFGPPFPGVTDLTLASDSIMYILSASFVYRYERVGTTWQRTHEVHSDLDSGHTIAVPLKNPDNDAGSTADWVIVGEGGPGSFSRVAWADFSQLPVKFEPPVNMRVEVPVLGDVHVIADDKFEQNKTVYAASHDVADTGGKIYRWVIDKSTDWDKLEPPNSAFYGLAMRNDILYGAWVNAESPGVFSDTGVDRTLFPRVNVPPPPEWDYLTEGLPVGVFFTREPSSLKISSNEYNNLWAIDDDFYNWTNQTGCLWGYTDMMSKVGPWTTSPASGDSIPVDPVSGRALEVDFKWRQLNYAGAYELQLAKDSDFSIVVLRNENIVPTNPLAPECYFPAGGRVPTPASGIANWGNLESGHTYYWRVRARATVTGEAVRSPWSATMYFTVEAGLPTASPYPTVTLFSPMYGAKNISTSPGFSWSGLPGTTKYEFILAKDSAFQKVVVKADVPTTSYIYDIKLDYNTGYFWQVRAIEPVVSDPSPIGTFTVVAEKKPVTPVTEQPMPIPSWVWWIIAVFTALVVVIIAFTMVKPSYTRPGGGKLFKVEPIVDKPEKPMLKSRIAKIWESITMAVRRQRYLRKRGAGESEVSKSEDSQDKLT